MSPDARTDKMPEIDTFRISLEMVFKSLFNDQFTPNERELADAIVERFFREGLRYYSKDGLIELFTPPEQGFRAFTEYVNALLGGDDNTQH